MRKVPIVSARRIIVRGVAACLLLVLLSSCTLAGTPTATPQPTPSVTAANNGVTLLLWHGWFGAKLQTLSRLVDRFNEQHPNGRVLLQAVSLSTFGADLRAASLAGSGPHIVLMPNSWIGGLTDANVLRPLDDAFTPAEQQSLLPVTLSGAQARDGTGTQRLYGLPISFDTLALYYNTANILATPSDTAALINSAHGLSDPNATPPVWGLAVNLSLDNTIGYLYAFGGRIFDDQGQLVLAGAGRAGTEQWLNWLLKLNADQQLLTHADSSIQIDRELKNNHVLMTFDWSHQLGVYRSLWGEHLGVAPLPRLSETDQPPRPYIVSEVLAINSRASAAERRAATEFLRFMISADTQRELLASGIQPTRTDVTLTGDAPQIAAARAFRKQAEQGQPMPNSTTRDIVWQELKLMQQHVLSGLASPPDAVSETDGRLREKLKGLEK